MAKFKDIAVHGYEVTFGAGSTYTDLILAVDEAGKALPNVPSLPHLNVIGSMVTSSHGSGINEPIMADHATSFNIVLADGTLLSLNKKDNQHLFYYYLMGLGGVGVIT